MEEIKEFFKEIGKENIDENSKNLVTNGLIDSLDIMKLVTQIEDFYDQELDMDFIMPENFEDFKTIETMIKKAFNL
ncbi:phosphopantetheine-binding protein [Campylobacter jejuni]|uniref:phosphopantetheine-binding protein n=1 Tax=Campylobacter jejuni TaxID=197 RepID=UPI000F8073BC|nr:phosphopantetheine-binding protein [Campylobacter jejuni]ECP6146739.1 acyl carrier protein [Campylobacter jejuni]EDP6343075.1 acyl carrier protein [Campylobacter jejuni]EEP3531693.1 acyl carrier protein [Campylobacter jejuni]EJV5812210.1 acyl carrier protein [Campylobacter jejuni]MCW1341640.1 phosphopantetheine-binding protein [Campylobacter jejuni]